MTKVALVTDSRAYFPQELVAQYAIRVAPQVLIWDGETYLTGWTSSPRPSSSAWRRPKPCPPVPRSRRNPSTRFSANCTRAGTTSWPC
ncbi:MAG TPA: hypothetical protein EYH28_05805 [Anaerolineaceae bacterium]|nr:hypothetical protein [Anaerolineaceae bacterium]